MIIYEALKKDHEAIDKLLTQLIDAADDGESGSRNRLVSELVEELVSHFRAEEAIFYNSLREIDSARDVVAHSYVEHMEAEGLLRGLQVTDAVNVTWVSGAKKLKQTLERHVEEEETKVFHVAKSVFLPREAEMMGDAFEKMKPEIHSGSIVESTMKAIANMMPVRLRKAVRQFTFPSDPRG